MTYRDRMPTFEVAVPAGTPDRTDPQSRIAGGSGSRVPSPVDQFPEVGTGDLGQPTSADRDESHQAVQAPRGPAAQDTLSDHTAPLSSPPDCGPLVTAESVLFRVDDADKELDGVRLEVDWILGDVDPEFSWEDGTWSLLLPRPPAWRLEYQLTLRRGSDYAWTVDPGNSRQVPNPFGPKSEIRFPDYREPQWLSILDDGTAQDVHTPAGRLTQAVPVRLWSPRGLSAGTPAPLLVAHDGSDLADRGSLLSWATGVSRSRPIRVALLDPVHGLRDDWYGANPDYADQLAEVVLPALAGTVAVSGIIGLGASLGGLSMLHLQRRHPTAVTALALQSGSFFHCDLDSQERHFPRFRHICDAVAAITAGFPLNEAETGSATPVPGVPVPVLMTCGSIEENRFNNEAMAAALARQGYPVTLRSVPDAHTMIGWRDAWFPALDELLRALP